jgi:predicted permease
MLRDLRTAWRSLAKSPGFVAVAVLALGLGLGLSTSMFGVIDAVLKPQTGFKNWDRLYRVNVFWSVGRGGSPSSAEIDRIIREQTHSFDTFLFEDWGLPQAEVGDEGREFTTVAVQPRFFDVYGVRPALGRAFTQADGEHVAVLSYDAWRVLSPGRQGLTGAHVSIGDQVYSVVGVLPRETGSAVWIPLTSTEQPLGHWWAQTARLAPGVTRAQAQAELDALAKVMTERFAEPGSPWGFHLVRMIRPTEALDDIHVAMVGAGLAVLLIACVNLGHLMLARGLGKRRELAIRMALGAGRPATVRLMLAETVLITAGGVILGALVAVWVARVAQNLIPPTISWVQTIRFQLSWRVFALGAVGAAASGTLFGLFPALRVAMSVGLTDPLKTEAGTTTGQGRSRYSPLVIAEVALALALLMGGGVLLRSVQQLRTTPQGFDGETLVNGFVHTGWVTRRTGARVDTVAVDWSQALEAVRRVHGVRDAALEAFNPTLGGAVTAEMTGDSMRILTGPTHAVVSPSYLRVHGLPVLKGRDFAEGDVAGNGVVILSSVAAARLYPKGNAVGRMLKLGSPRSVAPWLPIVGVARTPIVPWGEMGAAGGEPVFWVAQRPGKWWSATILARVASRDARTLIDVRRALRLVAASLTPNYVSAEWFNSERDAELASRTFLADVFVAMGAVGLALAALGLYGVLAYAVSRRMREFAVRVALGAEPRALFRMVMHDGLVMLLAGIGIGAFLALTSAYLFNAVLIGVYPTDALSLVLSEAVLLVVGLAATLAPARRAVRANPLDILRAI